MTFIDARMVQDNGETISSKLSKHAASILALQGGLDGGGAYDDTRVAAVEGRVDAHDTSLATINKLITDKTMGRVNVKEYGAVGDGVSLTDTAAIQKVLDLAKTQGGVECYIPKGVYRIRTRLNIFQNTRLIMEQGTVLLRDHNAGFFGNGVSGDNFTGYSGNGNFLIEGGILDGNIIERPVRYNAMGLARGQNIILRNVEIRDVRGAHAIDMNACKDVIIEKCRFLGYDPSYDTTGDNVSSFREAIQISGHTNAGFNWFGAYDGQPSNNVTVRDCYFGPSENLPAYPAGVGNHGATYDQFVSNIHVYNNVFEGCSYAGVRAFKYNDLFVHNNTFINCYDGIRHSNPDGDGNYDNGVPQSGKNIWITNNKFVGTVHYDIYIVGWEKPGVVAKVKNVQLSNNISEGTTTNTHIYLQFVDAAQIDSPIIKTAYRGIFLAYCNDVHLKNLSAFDIVTEAVWTNEGDAAWQNKGYSKNLFITGTNKVERCGRSAFNINYVDGIEIAGTISQDPCTETVNTRSAIILANGTKNGRVYQNRVRGANVKWGIEVTGTCSEIQTFNNDVVGTTGRQLNNSTGGFEGTYIYSPNGTRYRMTVSDAGAPVLTVG